MDRLLFYMERNKDHLNVQEAEAKKTKESKLSRTLRRTVKSVERAAIGVALATTIAYGQQQMTNITFKAGEVDTNSAVSKNSNSQLYYSKAGETLRKDRKSLDFIITPTYQTEDDKRLYSLYLVSGVTNTKAWLQLGELVDYKKKETYVTLQVWDQDNKSVDILNTGQYVYKLKRGLNQESQPDKLQVHMEFEGAGKSGTLLLLVQNLSTKEYLSSVVQTEGKINLGDHFVGLNSATDDRGRYTGVGTEDVTIVPYQLSQNKVTYEQTVKEKNSERIVWTNFQAYDKSTSKLNSDYTDQKQTTCKNGDCSVTLKGGVVTLKFETSEEDKNEKEKLGRSIFVTGFDDSKMQAGGK
jgi:hypothetical protein